MTSRQGIGAEAVEGRGDGDGVGWKMSERMAVTLEVMLVEAEGGGTAGSAIAYAYTSIVPILPSRCRLEGFCESF